MELKKIEGELLASGKRIAIVASRWNSFFSEALLEGAVDAIVRHGGSPENITVVRVPGSYEIPLTCRQLAQSKQFDALVAVGTLIRGETDHYDLIARELAAGIGKVMAETLVPIGFGVVTGDTMEQAMARSGSKAGNKGAEAALAAIEMANVMTQLREQR